MKSIIGTLIDNVSMAKDIENNIHVNNSWLSNIRKGIIESAKYVKDLIFSESHYICGYSYYNSIRFLYIFN